MMEAANLIKDFKEEIDDDKSNILIIGIIFQLYGSFLVN